MATKAQIIRLGQRIEALANLQTASIHGKGRSLVWVLSMLRASLETQALERLEQRLEELAPSIEGKGHGHTTANRTPHSTH